MIMVFVCLSISVLPVPCATSWGVIGQPRLSSPFEVDGFGRVVSARRTPQDGRGHDRHRHRLESIPADWGQGRRGYL